MPIAYLVAVALALFVWQIDVFRQDGPGVTEAHDNQRNHRYKPDNHHHRESRDQQSQEAQVGGFNWVRSFVHG